MKKVFLFLFLGIFMLNFASAALTDDIQSYLKLDDTSGNAIDSANSNDATLGGTPTQGVTGKLNTAYDLDLNDYLSDNDHPATTSNEGTIIAWVNMDSLAGQPAFVGSGSTGGTAPYGGFRVEPTTGYLTFIMYDGGFLSLIRANSDGITTGTWNQVAVTVDNSTGETKLYVNGYEVSSYESDIGIQGVWFDVLSTNTFSYGIHKRSSDYGAFDGTMDEVAIFSRPLNDTEILQMYHLIGNGTEYPFDGSPTVSINLLSPINDSTISDTGANFTAKFNISGDNPNNYTWKNATYNIWLNNTLFNSTTVSLSGADTNYTLFIDNFDFSLDSYIWNVKAYYGNDTYYNYTWADTNYTYDISLFTVTNETYVNTTIGGTLENFSLSIDLLEGYDLLGANFIYNGTTESPTITSEDVGRYLLVSDFTIPTKTSNTNYTFYWQLTFTGGIVLYSENRSQLVQSLLLDDCSVYTNEIFNISLYDESNREGISGDISIVFSVLNIPYYQIIETTNYSITDINSTRICSGLNLSDEDLSYSAEIRYASSGYVSELYYIQRAMLERTSQDLYLFLLNESSSTRFKITYQDSTFNFVEGAIVQLQRKYLALNQYETVEAPLTSSDGTSIVHIDLDSIPYRATVVKNGEILDEFDNLVFECQSELTGECEQTLLGEIDPENDINYDTARDFLYSISSVNDTITVPFSIPSGEAATVNILLTQKDSFGNTTLCNKSLVSSAGSIQCSFNNTIGDSFIDLKIYKNGVPIGENSYKVEDASSALDWLQNNFIIVVVLILSLVGLTMTSSEWMVLMPVLGLLISGALWLINGMDFVVGLGLIGFIFVAAIIIILKLAKQEDR